MRSVDLIPDICLATIENRFHLTKDLVAISTAKGVLVASPANPTGTTLTRAKLKVLIDAAKEK
jgi:aspartate/methionine/tyrosine aminotransferase